MNQSDDIKEIALAIKKSQNEMQAPIKDKLNPFHKNKYADLATCWESCSEVLNNNGIVFLQVSREMKDGAILISKAIHAETGQFISSEMPISFIMPPDKNHPTERRMTAQESAAAITYFRRASLCAFFMICPEDDDGNSASRKKVEDRTIENKIGPNQCRELSTLIAKCPPGFEKWLLDQVFKDNITHRIIENIPISFFDFCKKVIDIQIKKQMDKETKENE